MGFHRETADLFLQLKIYGLREFFRKGVWRSSYFWHDTFVVRWNRFIGCRFGHRDVKMVEGDGGDRHSYCFACQRKIL